MNIMKTLRYLFMAFALVTTTVAISSCDKDEPASCTDGIQNGDETGIDCGGTCAACPEGVQAKEYQSSGSDVAPLLSAFFGADSIYARFNLDNTYLVEQYDTNSVLITFTGTFSQTESNIDGIWDITLNQSSPSALTAVGIFEINNTTLTYEVVQTDPDIGAIPPTASAGFGSSNGGQLGTTNIQVFQEIE